MAVTAVVAACGGATQPGQSPSVERSPDGPGERTVLSVTFADGVTVDLVYPPELALEQLERTNEVLVAADVGGPEVRRDVRLARAGSLPALEGSAGVDFSLLHFGEWEALVIAGTDHGSPPLSVAERRAFSQDLAVEEAHTGFPVVVVGPGLRIARNPDDEAAPVMLLLGGENLDPGLALTRPDSCAASALEETWRCDEDASVVVAPYGDPEFQEAVLEQVDVRKVRPAA
jgi:hypothetical protein